MAEDRRALDRGIKPSPNILDPPTTACSSCCCLAGETEISATNLLIHFMTNYPFLKMKLFKKSFYVVQRAVIETFSLDVQ